MTRYKFAEIHCDLQLFRDLNLTKFKKSPGHDDYFQGAFTLMKVAVEESRKAGWSREKISGRYYEVCPECTRVIEGDGEAD